MNDFMISKWIPQCNALLSSVRKTFNNIGYDIKELPTTVFEHNKPISLVFVGQYSAGKSSIVKALTGIEEIEIGEGITTLQVESYPWNDLVVVDTPGIHTNIRPDHDKKSYRAIADADILVYVITQELFDDYIGRKFQDLLFKEDKAPEMILVVNKMGSIGNTLENQSIKLNDLEKVTTPYSPKDLHTVFVDAESYIASLSEDDPEVSEELVKQSNYGQLVDTLNSFVEEKGYLLKLTTVLYRVYDILQDALVKSTENIGDEDLADVEEHLRRERRILTNTIYQIKRSVETIYEKAAGEIRDKGIELANSVYNCTDEEAQRAKFEEAELAVQSINEACHESIICKVQELIEDYTVQLDDLYNSPFSITLKLRLEKRKDSGNPIISQFLKSEWITKESSKLVQSTIGTDPTANGLKLHSGSKAKEWVLNIGHYFGHKFKSWEANKWTQKLNVAGKAVGVAGVFLAWVAQAKESIDENKKSQEMRDARQNIRASFNEEASKMKEHYRNALNNMLNDGYQTKVNEIDEKLQEISMKASRNSEKCKLIEARMKECRKLISEIHGDQC